MNGWVSLTPAAADHWIALADEAHQCVAGETQRKRKLR